MHYIIFDLEATCWRGEAPENPRPEIIEIGAVRVSEFGEIEGEFCRFVRPILNPTLSDFCRELTTIEQIDVNRARPFSEVIEDFWDFIDIESDDYLLCSWGGFDRKMLISDCELHGKGQNWAESHANLKGLYQKMRRLRQPLGLKKAVHGEGLLWQGTHHRGISDAQNLAAIFVKRFGEWAF